MSEQFIIYCNGCRRQTNHLLKASHLVEEYVDIESEDAIYTTFNGSTDYQIVICKGCEGVTYRSIISGPDASSGNPLLVYDNRIERFYPERLENQLPLKSIPAIPQHIRLMYREVVEAYNSGLRVLVAGGLYELLKNISSSLNSEQENMDAFMQELTSRGLITQELAAALKMISFLGERAIALKNIPDTAELKEAIGLMETALEQLYMLPGRRIRLQEKLTNKFIRE
jgi:hypothetical protein